MFNYLLSLFAGVQVSDAYVNVLSIIVFFSLNFSFFDMFLFVFLTKYYLGHQIKEHAMNMAWWRWREMYTHFSKN